MKRLVLQRRAQPRLHGQSRQRAGRLAHEGSHWPRLASTRGQPQPCWLQNHTNTAMLVVLQRSQLSDSSSSAHLADGFNHAAQAKAVVAVCVRDKDGAHTGGVQRGAVPPHLHAKQ